MSFDLFHILQATVDAVVTAASAGLQFTAEAKTCPNCPGAESTLIAAAWANIGYMTHAAVLYYVNFGGIGLWAPLLYVIGAAGALIAVAINSPPRNYTWFLLGPAIYGFLVGSTQDVRGVDWVVAGKPQDMEEVWRDAETGLKNSPLLDIPKYAGININKYDGPSQDYPVAMPMLFMDELFSATSNILVGYTGLYNQRGTGGADTNLAKDSPSAVGAGTAGSKAGEGPWYLLSNLKSPMVENIVGTSIRNADLRDAFITFLASECGDAFKQGIDSGAYNGASLTRGAVLPMTVIKDPNAQGGNNFERGSTLPAPGEMEELRKPLNRSWMPTPLSLKRLFQEDDANIEGSLAQFTYAFVKNGSESNLMRRYREQVNCSAYLWTLMQGLRHESGHAYWQLVRSRPRGFTEEQFLKTLFYGWDIRKTAEGAYANDKELKAFTQGLVFVFLLKNELLFAPQITSVDQKFSPADQTRQYSQTHVATVSARSKHGELYNWALMMPHVQGILLYILIVGYPFAAMAMIIPGYWKAFFTWVTFFAWVKMWDVGFAIVQVLERSVWAMLGNHSNMSRVGNMLIQMADHVDPMTIRCNTGDEQNPCAVPEVRQSAGGSGSARGQDEKQAFYLLDKALILTAGVDLDISNGYYLYIMTALYFAVPAVTGQVILGAKAGAASLATNALGDNAKDAGGAAKSGLQGDMSSRVATAQNIEGQAAYGKSLRQGGFAKSALRLQNDNLEKGLAGSILEGTSTAVDAGAKAWGTKAASFGSAFKAASAVGGLLNEWSGGNSGSGSGKGGGGASRSVWGNLKDGVGALASTGGAIAQHHHDQRANEAQMYASGTGLDRMWEQKALGAKRDGQAAHADRLNRAGNYDAEMAQWDAKNRFAQRHSGMASVFGANNGLSAGSKPTDSVGMAMDGTLGRSTQQQAFGARSFTNTVDGHLEPFAQKFGNEHVKENWGGAYTAPSAGRQMIKENTPSGFLQGFTPYKPE
jgi:hypothetical protein